MTLRYLRLTALPANFVTWENGTEGENQLKRLVSRGTANTDVTVTATCGVSKSARIYVRRVDASNPTVTPDGDPNNVTVVEPANDCSMNPDDIESTYHATSVGNLWYPRIDTMVCTGTIKIDPWPNEPNTMTVPNTANPVDGGNICDAPGYNRWSYAQDQLADYEDTGAGPHWHNTAASRAHEWYHWNTDFMVTCIQTAGNWSGTETDIENLNVSVFDYLTEDDAEDALTASANARFNTFVDAVGNHWETVIKANDKPGEGTGAFAAGQAVLDEDIADIETYRISKEWW